MSRRILTVLLLAAIGAAVIGAPLTVFEVFVRLMSPFFFTPVP